MNEESLGKQERRRLAKEEKKQARERQESAGRVTRILLGVALLVTVGWGVFRWVKGAAQVELVGQEVADLGAQHKTDISGISYNSNPPTSGTHFPVWAKSGVYDRVISDGYLIHSLEHGYVIVSYDCTKLKITNYQLPITKRAMAHEGEEEEIPEGLPHPSGEATASAAPLTIMKLGLDGKISFFDSSNPPEVELELSESFNSEQCQRLTRELTEFYQTSKGKYERLIVVPRPGLDVPVALTAWTRILKLDQWNSELALQFVQAWHNRGPEKTVE